MRKDFHSKTLFYTHTWRGVRQTQTKEKEDDVEARRRIWNDDATTGRTEIRNKNATIFIRCKMSYLRHLLGEDVRHSIHAVCTTSTSQHPIHCSACLESIQSTFHRCSCSHGGRMKGGREVGCRMQVFNRKYNERKKERNRKTLNKNGKSFFSHFPFGSFVAILNYVNFGHCILYFWTFRSINATICHRLPCHALFCCTGNRISIKTTAKRRCVAMTKMMRKWRERYVFQF